MAITAAMVKELRECAPARVLMDAKKALTEAGGDIEAAVDALRPRALPPPRRSRAAPRPKVSSALPFRGSKGVAVEVNSETDFVAKNEQFQDFVRKITAVALGLGADDVDALKSAAYPDGGTVADKLTDNVATIGENMSVRRMSVLGGASVVTYVHNAAAPAWARSAF